MCKANVFTILVLSIFFNKNVLLEVPQLEILPECPNGFTDAGNFCYVLSDYGGCPFANVLPFDSYKQIISEETTGPVLMPLRRWYDLPRWDEPSYRYGTFFEGPFFYQSQYDNDFLYFNSSFITSVRNTANCTLLCAYQKLSQWENPLCSNLDICRQSSLSANSKCFCLETSDKGTEYPRAEFLEPYQNNVYGLLTNETCSIGLEKTLNGTFVWSNSQKEIDYSFWSSDVVFDDEHEYAVATPIGWNLSEELPTCSLVEKEVKKVSPDITLSLILNEGYKILINISDPVGLKPFEKDVIVYCFCENSNYLYRYSNITTVELAADYHLYQFEPFYERSKYWCDGFGYFNNKISSQNISLQDAFFTILFNTTPSDELTFSNITGTFQKFWRSTYCLYKNIAHTDAKAGQFCVNISCLRDSDLSFDYDWAKLVVNLSLIAHNDWTINFVRFYDPHYCLPNRDGNLTWSQASPGMERVYPEEFCFKPDGLRLGRYCYDSQYGPYWSFINETCEIQSKSSVTHIFGPSGSCTKLYEIAETFIELNALDISIRATPRREEVCLDILNEILQIESNVWAEAQTKVRTTDILLQNVLGVYSCFRYFEKIVFVRSNFACRSLDLSAGGITEQLSENSKNISTVANREEFDDILKKTALKSAAWIDALHPTTVTVLWKAHIFSDPSVFLVKNIPVYVVSAEYGKFDGSVQVIHRLDASFASTPQCASWETRDTQSSWEMIGEPQIDGPYYVCTFSRLGCFSLVLPINNTATQVLKDILVYKLNSFEKLSKLDEVFSSFSIFNSVDVSLVGLILGNITVDDQVDLDILCEIINSVQDIDQEILAESERDYGAAEKIVHSTDMIIKNQKYEPGFYQKVTKNFITLVCDVTKTDFSGFVILDDKIEILNSSVNITGVLAYENLTSALLLSSNLKKQLEEGGNVIIKIFLKDVLFVEKEQKVPRTVNKVFCVAFPDAISNYSGPVSIFQKAKNIKENHCGFWSHDVSQNTSGFWKTFGESEKNFSIVRCDFWQGTHFAFLSDDDFSTVPPNNTWPPLPSNCTFPTAAPYSTSTSSTAAPDNTTQTLTNILASNSTSSEMLTKLSQISSNIDNFTSADVSLVGDILEKIAGDNETDLDKVSDTISNLLEAETGVLQESQKTYGATDKILYNIDQIIKNQKYETDFDQTVAENFAILVYDVKKTNFSGFVLEGKKIKILESFVNITEVLSSESVTSLLFLSPDLKAEIEVGQKIFVSIFFKDTLFVEKKQEEPRNVSKIFSVILPEDITFTGPISIFHKTENTNNTCVHWSYNLTENISGSWKYNNKSTETDSFQQCDFFHTTHFALLLQHEDIYVNHHPGLQIITYSTCILSLFGYFTMILLTLIFKNWREKIETKILLNFIVSGILQIGAFYISSNFAGKTFCIGVGLILHYSVLANFCWMLNIAFYNYKKFSVVFFSRSSHILLKFSLFAYGFPLIPVISVFQTDSDNYSSGNVGLCYPSGLGLYLGVWLPILIIISINLIIFLCIGYAVSYGRMRNVGSNKSNLVYQWRLVIYLFFLLGLPWIFGFLSEINGLTVLVYFFCLLAGLQGFILFIFFIIFNRNIKSMHKRLRPS